jgi:spermidine synthase
MEIVWYRMLAPVLGGSSYTFGLVLAVALLGVGLGGAARAAWGGRGPAELHDLALSCAIEALCVALPFALGDRVAVLALLLRPLGGAGLIGLVVGWAVVASVVILPAALVAGWQFPLLVALLGPGGRRLGRDVARAYAWNTAGAIAGSLAGGFGLLPLLTAPGVWRAAALLLAIVGAAAAAVAFRSGRSIRRLVIPALTTVLAAALLAGRGPTAAWRHSAVGAGRERDEITDATPRSLRNWVRKKRREVAWEADGVESSVAMTQLDGYAFLVNGKVDGHVRGDAGTQVMGGLLGAILHPRPTRALVIGLGTGSSAGWLGAVPTMERVDVVELEPAVVRVARDSARVNHDALENPRIHLHFGDAREALLVSRDRYDVIFSEPSNPYRAGVSSLFTQEFYRAVAPRLTEGGVFLQWLQAYEIDGQALHTAFATLASVFPVVETWTTTPGDLILVACTSGAALDAARLRDRLATEPYRTALARAWRVTDLEGFLAHYVAGNVLSRAVRAGEGEYVSTDDRTLLEFAFARTAGHGGTVDADLLAAARDRGDDRPEVRGGPVDWTLVADERMAIGVTEGRKAAAPPGASRDQTRRGDAYSRYVLRDPIGVIATWQTQPRAPLTVLELEMLGEAFAEMGDARALPLIDRLRALEPIEADAILGRLRARQGSETEAGEALAAAFEAYHDDPWPEPRLLQRALDEVALPLAKDPGFARRLYAILGTPFSLRMLESDRLRARVELATRIDFAGLCVEALAPYEPDVPWGDSLVLRARCYRAAGDPRAARAEHDVEELAEEEGRWLSTGLVPAQEP